MNDTATIQSHQPAMVGRARFGRQSAGSAAGSTGGDFMAAMMQLLGNSADGMSENALDVLQGAQQSDDDEKQDPNCLAMQMMAELFGASPALADFMAAQTNETIMQMRQVLSGDAQNPMVQQLLAMLDGETAKTKESVSDKSAFSDAQTVPNSDAKQGEQTPEGQLLTAVQNTKDGTSSDSSLFGGQSQFQSAIMAAQKLLKSERKGQTETGALDIEKLQQAVDTGRYRSLSAMSEEGVALDRGALAEQLKSGVSQTIISGRNEFTVKLKPEGLGEITVKLIESAGKTTLSLISSNAQTTKLLMGELATLRDTMRPYHVEVQEVVTQSEHASSNLAQSEQFSQSFAEHQHRQFAQSGNSFAGQLAGDDEDLTAQSGAALPLSELDTYI